LCDRPEERKVMETLSTFRMPRRDVSRSRGREFKCEVVQETVQIRLRRASGFGRPKGYFVQCNQLDCQYVEENKPPCPLCVDMFADEIKAAEEARRDRAT